MTTGRVPNPPDRLTSQFPTQGADATTQPGIEAAPAEQPLTLTEDMARIIAEQSDSLAQRLVYHVQLLYGPGAFAIDIVSARNCAIVISNALRSGTHQAAVDSLMRLGSPQNAQINDNTVPFKNNAQVAGLFEGLLIDVMQLAYRDDPARLSAARLLLESISQEANEQLQRQSRALGPVSAEAAQWTGGHPNARS